jgi:hypothetical protein
MAPFAWAGDTEVAPAGQPWQEYPAAAGNSPLGLHQSAMLSPPFVAAVVPADMPGTASSGSAIPAQELAASLEVSVAHKRRRFRSGAVSWMTQRSPAMGKMTDLLLGGADTGWHLVVDPRGADEYILEWKIRFR